MPPTDPIRLQVLKRVDTVLKAITAGEDFFYTPAEIANRFKTPEECAGYPAYMVCQGSGGPVELGGAAGADSIYDEDFPWIVRGIVQDGSDPRAALERALRDVRKAIMDDSQADGVAGSLAQLAVETVIEETADTDEGLLAPQGFGAFEQRFRSKIAGEWGEL